MKYVNMLNVRLQICLSNGPLDLLGSRMIALLTTYCVRFQEALSSGLMKGQTAHLVLGALVCCRCLKVGDGDV